MFDTLIAAALPSTAMTVTVGGTIIREVIKAELVRDLSDISHSFEVELRDGARVLASLPFASPSPSRGPMACGERVTIAIHGEPVLIGWIDEVTPTLAEGIVNCVISGRDVTGDLVDCAAAPRGPTEYKSITVLDLAKKICAPFEINVRAEVDVGAPFDKASIDAGETAMSAIEKYARRRGLLIVSDGIGGLVLTRSGRTMAPGAIIVPGNAFKAGARLSWANRFSDYFVKGQTKGAGGARARSPRLDATAEPLGTPPPASSGGTAGGEDEGGSEGRGVSILGHARDEEIDRWRPTVLVGRTEMTQSDAKTYALWAMKTRRAKGTKLTYSTTGYRGAAGGLWRHNQLVPVTDAYDDIQRDMLIGGLTMTYDDRGETTQMRLAGREAYDPKPEGPERNRGGGRRSGSGSGGSSSSGGSGRGLDSTPRAL